MNAPTLQRLLLDAEHELSEYLDRVGDGQLALHVARVRSLREALAATQALDHHTHTKIQRGTYDE
jgi:hypothetical protein